MDEMLSQEELDALLASMGAGVDSGEQVNSKAESDILSDTEIDAIGEIANICAGSSATNLSTVLNQKVNITEVCFRTPSKRSNKNFVIIIG